MTLINHHGNTYRVLGWRQNKDDGDPAGQAVLSRLEQQRTEFGGLFATPAESNRCADACAWVFRALALVQDCHEIPASKFCRRRLAVILVQMKCLVGKCLGNWFQWQLTICECQHGGWWHFSRFADGLQKAITYIKQAMLSASHQLDVIVARVLRRARSGLVLTWWQIRHYMLLVRWRTWVLGDFNANLRWNLKPSTPFKRHFSQTWFFWLFTCILFRITSLGQKDQRWGGTSRSLPRRQLQLELPLQVS